MKDPTGLCFTALTSSKIADHRCSFFPALLRCLAAFMRPSRAGRVLFANSFTAGSPPFRASSWNSRTSCSLLLVRSLSAARSNFVPDSLESLSIRDRRLESIAFGMLTFAFSAICFRSVVVRVRKLSSSHRRLCPLCASARPFRHQDRTHQQHTTFKNSGGDMGRCLVKILPAVCPNGLDHELGEIGLRMIFDSQGPIRLFPAT